MKNYDYAFTPTLIRRVLPKHEELFGNLASDNFTAQEAAEYLEVSMSTFQRFVASEKLNPSSTVGRNQMFAVADLKAFKKALRIANG